MKTLYILCGPPASGKSTWVKECLSTGAEYVSRDEIRFSMLLPGDDYFAHEREVVDEFINSINKALRDPAITDVYVDSTLLSTRRRKQFINNIQTTLANKIIFVSFELPLSTLLERNAQRTGRARVPDDALKRMFHAFKKPAFNEGYIDEIIHVDENGVETYEYLDK